MLIPNCCLTQSLNQFNIYKLASYAEPISGSWLASTGLITLLPLTETSINMILESKTFQAEAYILLITE